MAPAAVCPNDTRESLLAEIEFKWLMAGHGWWIDMARFHGDCVYAAEVLRLAASSDSPDLRQCAAVWRARAPSNVA